MKSLLESEPYMDEREHEFISELTERVSSQPNGEIIDLSQWLHWLSMDVIMDLSFSDPIGFVKQGKDVRSLIQSIHDLSAEQISWSTYLVWLNFCRSRGSGSLWLQNLRT
jgi:hypothetical protein